MKTGTVRLTGILIMAVTVVLFLLGLCVGSVRIAGGPLSLMFPGFLNRAGEFSPAAGSAGMILFQLRLPRMIAAFLVGMMLSTSGVVVQAVFRNPLADPYIIGISASAVTGAVIAYLLKLPDLFYGVFAFIVSLAVTFLIFRLSVRGGAVSVSLLLIIGIAVSSFMGSLTSFAMYWIGEDSYRITVWLMGYLGNAGWKRTLILIPPLAAALLFFYYRRLDLDALMRGDEEAHSLGVNTGSLKKQLLAAASLIAAFSVAFTGLIGFVGLIVPHTVRMAAGGEHRTLLPLAALGGGAFLLASDIIARTVLAPVEIPIGIVTAFFGAPFFLYLAFIRRKEAGFL